MCHLICYGPLNVHASPHFLWAPKCPCVISFFMGPYMSMCHLIFCGPRGSPGGVPGGSQGTPGNGSGLVARGASKSLHGSDTFTYFGENRGGEFCFPQGTYDRTQKTIKIHWEFPFQISMQFWEVNSCGIFNMFVFGTHLQKEPRAKNRMGTSIPKCVVDLEGVNRASRCRGVVKRKKHIKNIGNFPSKNRPCVFLERCCKNKKSMKNNWFQRHHFGTLHATAATAMVWTPTFGPRWAKNRVALLRMMKNHEIDKTTADQRTCAQNIASSRCGVNAFLFLQHPRRSKPILAPKSHFARDELCPKRGKVAHSPPKSKNMKNVKCIITQVLNTFRSPFGESVSIWRGFHRANRSTASATAARSLFSHF